MNGYGGSILRVDLTNGTWKKEPTPPELARDWLGGRGFGAYLLYKEVPKGADPLGPENKLFISTGPFSGMLIPGGGKCDWTTKSPLTGGYADASMGGHFTAEMKYAGLDTSFSKASARSPSIFSSTTTRSNSATPLTCGAKAPFEVEKDSRKNSARSIRSLSSAWRRERCRLCLHQP